MPVRKVASTASPPARPGGDDLPHVFSGSLVVRGSGIAEVTATGPRSEIDRIGQSLTTLETEPPRLQAQMRRLVRLCAIFGGVVGVLAVVLYGTLRGGWLDALLAGIAIGMSMLPEELPVVLTVFMAMGAWRISKARVLTRRAAAIETLGSASFGRLVTITRNCAGTTSSRSEVSAPISTIAAAQHGQAVPSGTSTTSIRGRWAGSAPRLARPFAVRSFRSSGSRFSASASALAIAVSRSARPSSNCSSGSRSDFRPNWWRCSLRRFGACAEAQTVVLRLQRITRGAGVVALRHHLDQEGAQDRRIVGECGDVERVGHAGIVADPLASRQRRATPATPRGKRYPATSGRAVQAGIRQSIPSSSIDNCAGVSDTTPPCAAGHTNFPRSSRLA